MQPGQIRGGVRGDGDGNIPGSHLPAGISSKITGPARAWEEREGARHCKRDIEDRAGQRGCPPRTGQDQGLRQLTRRATCTPDICQQVPYR